MIDRELAQVLIETLTDAHIDKKIAVYVNRLLLRLHSQPSLMSNLADVTVFKPGIEGSTDDQVKDGSFHEDQQDGQRGDEQEHEPESDSNSEVMVQLSFRRLPQEIISPLLRLIAAPREVKLYQFTHDGQARTGVQIALKPSDFPGDEYDYSF